jgi:glutamine synthetase
VLKRVLAIAAEAGYDVKMGHEYEFYVVDLHTRQPIYGGQPIFATARTHERPEMQKLMDVLDASGVDMITTNAEHGPGQWELNFDALDGVAAADRAFVFKNTVKEYLKTQGLLATFMTKPYKGLSGSCSHFHVSLKHRDSGANAFFDPADPDGMSQTMRHFIQGVLDHARAEMAMWNPTPNCYRRIRPKTYAPSNVSWGIEDRSASVRVKASRDEREHIEVRVPSALSNPYLVAAATIAAGLLGVRDKLPLMDNGTTLKEDNPMFRKLPQSLEESIAALEADTAMVEMLGGDIVKVFAATKRQELSRFADEIPPHEVAEYFELY